MFHEQALDAPQQLLVELGVGPATWRAEGLGGTPALAFSARPTVAGHPCLAHRDSFNPRRRPPVVAPLAL